jgi:hypothetical protein
MTMHPLFAINPIVIASLTGSAARAADDPKANSIVASGVLTGNEAARRVSIGAAKQ